MMEEFYADPEFQDVADPETGRQLLAILFWVRDADKLANFYIQRYEDNLKRSVFRYHERRGPPGAAVAGGGCAV